MATSNVWFDKDPGRYTTPQVVNWTVSDQVNFFAVSQGNTPASISEYIAYDTLTPPGPFIAVTQDGTGNVVYDGGFPKFYNSNAPAPGTPFSGLTASFKYLWNAINWVADKTKVAAGNKNILIIGDASTTESTFYAIKSTDTAGFYTSLTRLCASMGFTPTFKERTDYAGGYLDPRTAELANYACVLFFGSYNGVSAQAFITDGAVADLVAYRAAGGGIIMITDDGPDIASAAAASPPPPTSRQFFAGVNKLAVKFGAWFSGNFDRTPVNVGFLRANYGDHPLYAGMANTESIDAGGSESVVKITPFTKYTKAAPPAALNFPSIGRYIVQVTAKLKDGNAETYRVVFIIGDGNIIKWVRKGSTTEITSIDLGLDWQASLDFVFDSIGLGTLAGSLYQNTTKIGTISSTDAGGAVVTWNAGTSANLRLKDGDVLNAAFETPLQASSLLTVKRIGLGPSKDRSIANIIQAVKGVAGVAPPKVLRNLFGRIQSLVPAGTFKNTVSTASMVRVIRDFIDNNFTVPPFAPMLLSPLVNSAFINPVNSQVISPQYKVFSVTYGWQNLPANLSMLYYNNINFPAGTYIFMGAADDQLTVEIDGVVQGNLGGGYTNGAAVAKFEVTLTAGVHVLKLTNVNVPANTPGYFYLVIIDKATGNIFHQPTPDTWRSSDIIG